MRRLHGWISGALALTAAALLAPAPAAAGEGCGQQNAETVVLHIFQFADTDGDGLLSAAEYEEAGLGGYGLTFEQSDLDGNGETSWEEYLELYLQHHPEGGEQQV